MTDKPRKTEPPKPDTSLSDKESPIPLFEDASGDRFLIYATEGGVRVELQVAGDTFWATQQQMADAFGVTR